jgi:lipopolysaccharide export system protein LptA
MLSKRRVISLLGLFLLVCTLSPDAYALEQEGASNGPVRITSERLEADQKSGLILFKGNVVARQEDAVIMSNLLTLYYNDRKEIDRIVATEDVRINQAERVGTCGKATYYLDDKRIVMEEEPRVWREGDVVEGDVITIFLDSDKMLVEGAKLTIQPKNNGQGKSPDKDSDKSK